MAATFTWQIPTCEHIIADGGINVVHWRCTASETVGEGDDAVVYSASSYGTQGLTPDASAEGFIAYDSVTEDNVKSWIWADGNLDKAGIEAGLQGNIDAQKNPVSGSGVPW